MGRDKRGVKKKEAQEESAKEMGGRWRVKKREMNTYAPVALLSQQYFKPHLTVIAAEEGGETVEEGGEIRGDGYHAEGKRKKKTFGDLGTSGHEGRNRKQNEYDRNIKEMFRCLAHLDKMLQPKTW